MYSLVLPMKMVSNIMNLGMAVMAAGNTIISPGGNDLVEFHLAVSTAFFRISRLQESPAAAAAVIIGFVRGHFDDVFLTDYRFDNKSQIVGDGIAKAFPDYLTGVLDGECNLKILIPVGTHLKSPFTNPFCII